MVKKLRSLLHEQFPLDLRVKIELLSRRRDISNKEKQEELFKLLREFNVEGIVPLGPGTNRYAFKIAGFVVKVATDNDGKIDNLKEFKMSKRLFPYVTKTYEVSSNGTLLVAEYIQPFSSYGEMLVYADKIRAILKKLSTVYLIGDVGVTSKNYANWGLRVGSDEPVCLDFAYVYSVSSELFICRHCKANAMLVPNNDFTALICQNPACAHTYLFEDIRRRIGNDLHRHEIGDLTEEGYELFESSVPTELDLNRSNYLAHNSNKKEESKHKTEEVIDIPDDFEFKLTTEDKTMKRNEMLSNLGSFYGAKMVKARVIGVAEEPVSTSGLAFECDMNETDEVIDAVVLEAADEIAAPTFDDIEDTNEPEEAEATKTPVINVDEAIIGVDWNRSMSGKVVDDTSELQTEGSRIILADEEVPLSEPRQVIDDKIEKAVEHLAEEGKIRIEGDMLYPVETEETETFVMPEPKPAEVKQFNFQKPEREKAEPKKETNKPTAPAPAKIDDNGEYKFDDNFISNIQQAISKFARKISDCVYADGLFDEVRPYCKNKRFMTGDFQKMTQNVVFVSLADLCELECSKDENGKRSYTAGNMHGKGEATLRFLERIWMNRALNSVDAHEMMKKYKKIHSDYLGFQPEMRDEIISRTLHKKEVDISGAEILADYIMEHWGAPVTETEEPVNPDPQPTDSTGAEAVIAEEKVEEKAAEQEPEEVAEEEPIFSTDTNEGTISFTEEELDDADELLEDSDLHVEIWREDDIDIIHIVSDDAFGEIRIPFYVSLDKINVNEKALSESEGYWEWLKAMVPDLMFTTKNPDRWLKLNAEQPLDEISSFRFVVLTVRDNDEFVMGIYNFAGVRFIDEDDEAILTDDEEIYKKLALLFSDLPRSNMSHIRRSISVEDLIYTEEYIKSIIDIDYLDDSNETEEESEMTENQAIALQALLGDSQAPTDEPAKEEVKHKEETTMQPLKPVPAPQKKKAEPEPVVFQPIHRASAK